MSKQGSDIDLLLLSNLRMGDKKAFDNLYERHWDKVFYTALKKIKDVDVAKDITQEVFTYIWLNRETNHILDLDAYFFSAVRNNVFRLMKREKRFTSISELIVEHKNFCSADTEILEKELFIAYERLVQSMCPAQREIYNLRYKEDLSTYEIAKQLNISRKTVQNQLGRALTLLRTSLMTVAILVVALLKS